MEKQSSIEKSGAIKKKNGKLPFHGYFVVAILMLMVGWIGVGAVAINKSQQEKSLICNK